MRNPKKKGYALPILFGTLGVLLALYAGFAAWTRFPFEDAYAPAADGAAVNRLAQRVRADRVAFPVGQWEAVKDAYPVYGDPAGQLAAVPDAAGSAIDKAKSEAAFSRYTRSGRGDSDPDAAGVYRHADALSTSPQRAEENEKLNRFLSAEVVYTVGETSVSFSAQRLAPYVDMGRGASQSRYSAQAAAEAGVFSAFADELAEAFDGVSRDFITHDGAALSVTEKTWHAKLDRAATAEALAALTFDELAAGGTVEGTLVWEKAPLDALQNYVEIDLSNQQLYLYTGGGQVLESPIVSGCVAQRHTTPGGAFSLAGKSRNVVLRGPDYANFVNYWMPFNNQIGMHDATWRSRFGGTIYKTDGSHGCINLPRDVAAAVYGVIDGSYAVVCYWRDA